MKSHLLPRVFVIPALVLAVLVSALLTGPTTARAEEELKNIKVFPKDITKRELEETMHHWSDALGVRCTHCHEQKVPGDFRSIDFASDAIDKKQTARRMMKMVQDLNADTLPKAAGEDDAAISCVTCHRGLQNPATLDQVILHEIRKNGADAGVLKYRDLRTQYFGSGSYDFGPDSLDPAIQALAGQADGLDAAKALVDLEIEVFPDNSDSRVKLAQILMMKDDPSGAIAALDEALRLDPENRRALRMKQQLGN